MSQAEQLQIQQGRSQEGSNATPIPTTPTTPILTTSTTTSTPIPRIIATVSEQERDMVDGSFLNKDGILPSTVEDDCERKQSKFEMNQSSSSKSIVSLSDNPLQISQSYLASPDPASFEGSNSKTILEDPYFDFNSTEQGKRIAKDFCNFLIKNDALFDANMALVDEDEETKQEHSTDNDDDESIVTELTNLAEAEELLRQELYGDTSDNSTSGGSRSCNSSAMDPCEPPELTPNISSTPSQLSASITYTLFDHSTFLNLSYDPNLRFICDVSRFFSRSDEGDIHDDVKELCEPLSEESLSCYFFGLQSTSSSPIEESKNGTVETPLPVRTLAIQIRPDVRCGTLMDAVYASIETCPHQSLHLLKRQGGHLRALAVQGTVSYVVDAQLCITRKKGYKRHLLLRFFYPSNNDLFEAEASNGAATGKAQASSEQSNLHLRGAKMNLHLKECCSLVQLIMNKRRGDQSWQDMSFPRPKKADSPKTASTYLQTSYRRSYSVLRRKGRFTTASTILPALSNADWDIVQASWSMCDAIWSGMGKSFSYSSLSTQPVKNNAANGEECVVDFHLCMQLFALSEERMTCEVSRVVSKLEVQVEGAEATNQIFEEITAPMFEKYNIEKVEELAESHVFDTIPEGDQSQSETFDLIAKRALESSNCFDSESIIPRSNIDVADNAVSIVYAAYSTFHNRMQTEKVKEANIDIMNQLFKKQTWLRDTYKRLRDSFRISKDALQESKACFQLTQKASNLSKLAQERIRLVPILSLELVGGGNCYVTATHIILSMTVRRRFQRAIDQVFLFDLEQSVIELVKPGLLRIYTDDEDTAEFRPCIDADRFKTFAEIVQSLQGENEDS